MRKMPFRPNNEISQTYNSGRVEVYRVEDSAQPGYQPVVKATLKYTIRYDERVLGINRLYLSRQNQAEIQRVIRVARLNITSQDIAITEDGVCYRIDTVQSVEGVYPPSLDLALKRLTEKVEVVPGALA